METKIFHIGNRDRECTLIACPTCKKERWIISENLKKQTKHCKSCAMKKIWLKRKGPPKPRPPEEHNGKWKGKIIDGHGYIKIRLPNHPMAGGGYVFEHRLIMAEHLGRMLEPWEAVHHKNGIKHDNRIENLELMPKSEHRSISPLHHRIIYLENLLKQNNIPF